FPNTTDDDNGVGTNSQVNFTATSTGSYYLSAGAYSSNIGTYKLSVLDLGGVAPTDDHGVTAATAGSVSVGGSTSGNIEVALDQDWYGVSLVAGTTYQIDLEGTPTNNGSLTDPFLM